VKVGHAEPGRGGGTFKTIDRPTTIEDSGLNTKKGRTPGRICDRKDLTESFVQEKGLVMIANDILTEEY